MTVLFFAVSIALPIGLLVVMPYMTRYLGSGCALSLLLVGGLFGAWFCWDAIVDGGAWPYRLSRWSVAVTAALALWSAWLIHKAQQRGAA